MNVYKAWLINCVDVRNFSFPQIALFLISWVDQYGMTRRQLLDTLKRDYADAKLIETKKVNRD